MGGKAERLAVFQPELRAWHKAPDFGRGMVITMDVLTDKFARRLTAQELIRANSAAEAEETRRLRGQVKEYEDCLAKMRVASEEIHAVTGRVGRLVEEEVASKLERLTQQLTERLAEHDTAPELERQIRETLAAGLDAFLDGALAPGLEQVLEGKLHAHMNRLIEEAVAPQVSRLTQDCVEKIRGAQPDSAKIDRLVEEGLAKIQEIQQDGGGVEEVKDLLRTLFEQSEEHVHKENVKVYRNVQAVVVEEHNKQGAALLDMRKKLNVRLRRIQATAALALAAALAGVLFQALRYFQVL